MRVLTGPRRRWAPLPGRASVTIGALDGVHRGHQALLAGLDDKAVKTVLTFDPHPMEVLTPGSHPRLLTTIDERIDLLRLFGVEQVGVLDLGEIRGLSPRRFVREVLVESLQAGSVVVGSGFRFGEGRAGDTALLREIGEEHGLEAHVLSLVGDNDGAVSSSRIRGLIESGRVAEVEELMGRRFRLTGTVIGGAGRGRELGYPTANMMPPSRKVMPATGIYAAYAHVGAESRQAAVSIGVRPTFGGGGEVLIEAHLLDYSTNLRGATMTLELVECLRPERRFDTVADLVTAIGADVEDVRRVLGAATPDVV